MPENDIFGRPELEGLSLDDMYETDGPFTGLGSKRPPRQQKLGPDVPRGRGMAVPDAGLGHLAGTTYAGRPDWAAGGRPTVRSGETGQIIPDQAAVSGSTFTPPPQPAVAPAGAQIASTYTRSPSETGPGAMEERFVNAYPKDAYRTQLLQHEGSTLKEDGHKIYPDASGYATGYGHKMLPQDFAKYGLDPNDKAAIEAFRIPDADARGWFDRDSSEAMANANSMLRQRGIPTDTPVTNIVANMTYQMGAEGVSKFTDMLDALEAGDNKAAARAMLDSKWAGQTKGRAEELAKQMANTPIQKARKGLLSGILS